MKLFEASWEVCNKCGGIYTVINSKSRYLKDIEEHIFIGPYFQNDEFYEKDVPEKFKEEFQNLSEKGIVCHYGVWKENEKECVLIDFSKLFQKKNEIKKELWEDYQIDSLHSGFDFEEPVLWSWAVGMFLEEVSKKERIIGQFHEWLTGAGILYLKKKNANVGTVFTTHATVLERAMASSGEVYSGENDLEEAKKRGVIDKHLIEKQSSLNCDAFTTVSELVAESCEKIFKRKPELTLNGMDLEYFNNVCAAERHKANKKNIRNFLKAYFFPYYYFDLNKTKIFFISGRYEWHSKGLDVFINSLGKLNNRLKEENGENIVVMFFIPAGVREKNNEIFESMKLIKEFNEKLGDLSEDLKNKIFKNKEVLKDNDFFERFEKNGNPALSTYSLNYENDQIIAKLMENGLNNEEEDKVKVIFHPCYLDDKEEFFGLDYYDVTSGCDLGVFPSFYEPWGYTPVESAVVGVPAITTDRAGFGKFVRERGENGGILVLNREGVDDADFEEDLCNTLHWYSMLDKEEIKKRRLAAKDFCKNVDWKVFVEDYLRIYKRLI